MADVDAYALTSLANVREYFQVPASDISKDELYKKLINRASDAIEKHCRRLFKSRAHTETRYLDLSSTYLFVSQYPITTLTSISDDGTALTAAELADCENRETFIVLDTERSGKLIVVYTAGYTTIPDDLEQACIMLVQYYEKTDIANFSTVFAESGQAFKPSKWPPHVIELLKSYVKKVP